ncbi:IPExxxVDY family protein [Robiginitalea sp. IMCC43444]|uniref:IPExxxVDY family protein n=1 Tax=Robiginitalea sp. IMCC43444 TaxID=3459121 RepID=UPI004041335B
MGSLQDIWEEFLEDTSFGLFAIHCNLEDHALAYSLNRECKLHLCRSRRDIELKGTALFPVFQWEEEAYFRTWTLFRNFGSSTGDKDQTGLFQNEPTFTRHYLIPEKKEVDYFLKVEGDDNNSPTLARLLSIKEVITAYRVPVSDLKSKQNLLY